MPAQVLQIKAREIQRLIGHRMAATYLVNRNVPFEQALKMLGMPERGDDTQTHTQTH